MLQTNLIFGIQKQIKKGKTPSIDVLEESDLGLAKSKKKEILLENYYNPGIISGVYDQVKNSKKKTSQKRALMTESFHMSKAEKKLGKDINYFNYLYENFVPEVFQEQYQILLENIFEDTIRLYQECDVTPRVISPAIDSNELTENQIVDLYKNALNKTIKDDYTKPLLSGKITEIFENEIRVLTKKLLEEGVSADIEQVRIYLPFEETIYQFNREVMVPRNAQNRIDAFMESTTQEYNDLLEESAEELMRGIEKKIKLLTSMISPDMFNKVVDANGVNAPKMAGISIAVDKNFNDDGIDGDLNDDGEICPMEAAAMDPEAAEELAAEDEAEELDADGEDIVGAEEDAKDDLGQASSSEDLEEPSAEDAAELSASENSEDDDQPGAIEKDLPSESSSLDAGGHSDNTSDVDLQGSGNDNGEDVQSLNATLPGSSVPGSTQDVDSEGSSDKELSADAGTVSMDVETSIDTEDEPSVNDDDVGLSAGAGTIGKADIGVDKEEIIGADGDNDNPIGGEMVDKEDDEVATATPSEDEMDSKDEEGAIEDSSLPIPRL